MEFHRWQLGLITKVAEHGFRLNFHSCYSLVDGFYTLVNGVNLNFEIINPQESLYKAFNH